MLEVMRAHAPLLVLLVLTAPASAEPVAPIQAPTAAQRQGYWNQGKAELTSFELQQARYGELHPGSAVLIFVTEPFSKTKQVKLDDPRRAPDDAVEVLKLKEGEEIEIHAAGARSLVIARKPGAAELLARLRKFRGRLPEDFKFDRLEAAERG